MVVMSCLSKFCDRDLDPQGNLAKVDNEDVATYFESQKGGSILGSAKS